MPYLGDFDSTTPHGRILRSMLTGNETADDQMIDALSMLTQMRSGDGSQDAHYTDVVKFLRYGGYTPVQGDPTPAQLQLARASYEELASADFATSAARAARTQLYAKHRG